MKLILPFPPSVNTYWRHPNKGAFAGKSLISEAGRKFQSAACAAIVEQLRRLPKPTSAPASVEIVLFPPDNRIRDLDNYNKALFDALTHAGVWEDDRQVKRMLVEWGPVTSGRWSYVRQLYGHVYTAKTGTLSELVTAGDQFNQQHITLAGYEKETQTPADELAASRTARAAVFIRNDPARPTQTGELVGMLPAPKGKRFTMTEQQTLLSHGVATAYVESGVLRIQRDVTTYRKNAYGVADNSYLDSETLHTSAYVLRKLKSVITSKYGRHKLASDGTRFGPGQAIVTPAVIKGELLATYRQLERAGIVENYELFKQYLVVERDASDPDRLNTLFPPDYVNQLRVFAVVNQFRLQYSEESA
ncbi:phage tail sheath subtilisin-like domain-containing protein [Escherichia coli]|nr:phage tail sheath subtilisin-like domain-containing protein [Escherichia coli]